MSEQAPPTTQRRGERLREHILWSAKEVFLRSGYDGASMDAVAAAASTSKRSLYTYFRTKENLFLAVIELVRSLYLERLRTPAAYSDDPVEAVVLFCARMQQLDVWESQARTFRLVAASADRLPDGARAYYDAVVASGTDRLAQHLSTAFGLPPTEAATLAQRILTLTVLPRFMRTVLGVQPALAEVAEDLGTDVDVDAVREIVVSMLPHVRRRTAQK